MPHPRISVTTTSPELQSRAQTLAQTLNLSYAPPEKINTTNATYKLTLTPERLELRSSVEEGAFFVDFSDRVFRRRLVTTKKSQELGRAVGLKGGRLPRVIDATAGRGQDAFMLASFGCQVRMVERSPVIAALLADGLARAQQQPDFAGITPRLSLMTGNASEVIPELVAEQTADVIYIDPMYPASGKSAKKEKAMRYFRAVVGDDDDALTLLRVALECTGSRVVVKRPLKAEALVVAGLKYGKPSASIKGKTTRFDLYFRVR